jgi:glycosyltransferase involved in cell wall biosynthesis
MIKVMFIVYHDIKTEARSQEILECAKKLGKTVFVSYSKPFDNFDCKCIQTGNGKRNYFNFIRGSIKAIKVENPDIIILHDNYTAAILRWLYKHRKNTYVIYDSSELHIHVKPTTLKTRIAIHMSYFEKKYLKYADIVIAANNERATIMKDYFKLKETPIIFDNMHKIVDNYDATECAEKYRNLLMDTKSKFHIVYAGGIDERRLTFQLVEAVGKLGQEYQLTVIGSATLEVKERFNGFVEKMGYKNIGYYGIVSRAELRYLIQNAHASVSAFVQNTANNKYCASGKLYESIFEGVPVITSDNPPLKKICDTYNIGVSGSSFEESILQLRNNYDFYKECVQNYIAILDYDLRVENLSKSILSKLSKV